MYGDPSNHALGWALGLLLLLSSAGCGTTRWTDTPRSATEQLLISDAIERAVSGLDFSALSGNSVFFDSQYLAGSVDEKYLVSTVRQHLLASGAYLREYRDEADYVVEARSGAIGTNRDEVLVGVPQVNVPTFVPLPVGLPSTIPEIPFVKSTDQEGVAKIAVFAYHRETGRPVWQSGISPVSSEAKDTWVFGAGPFQRGTIYKKAQFAGSQLELPLTPGEEDGQGGRGRLQVPVTAEMSFENNLPANVMNEVQQASATEPLEASDTTGTGQRASGTTGAETPPRRLSPETQSSATPLQKPLPSGGPTRQTSDDEKPSSARNKLHRLDPRHWLLKGIDRLKDGDPDD
jgi:hypothetical protein